MYKLATTMGILGQHDSAYTHFRRLLKDEETAADPALAHYAAVAAYNTARYDVAERLWRHVSKLDPGSEVSQFYLSGLDAVREGSVSRRSSAITTISRLTSNSDNGRTMVTVYRKK